MSTTSPLASGRDELLVYMLACVDAGTADRFELTKGELARLSAKGRRIARRLIERDAAARARYEHHLARELASRGTH